MTQDIDSLVDQVTREVMARLGPGTTFVSGDSCSGCGRCSQKCPDKVRRVLDAGATRFSAHLGSTAIPADLAQYIDHALLKPEATPQQIEQLCQEARQFGFASVCVNPANVKQAAQLLRGTPVKVCAVVGFPLGATTPEVKAFEARKAIRDGAREIDMVINIGALKSGLHDLVRRDISMVADACHEVGGILKVIIEAALLTDAEKITACQLAAMARADYVKTSTGFGPGGATTHDVALMRQAVCGALGVKAAGGIRTLEETQAMIAAGATRIGASAGVRIMQEAKAGRA